MIDANGFDRDFYLNRNPDVAAAGIDLYRHFLQYGWREGRNPNPLFDTRFYLSANPDVAAARIDLLGHCLTYGWREGRDPSVAFDTSDYLAANRDVAAAGINPMSHYLLYGQVEHRRLATDYFGELAEGFDRGFYVAANPEWRWRGSIRTSITSSTATPRGGDLTPSSTRRSTSPATRT